MSFFFVYEIGKITLIIDPAYDSYKLYNMKGIYGMALKFAAYMI